MSEHIHKEIDVLIVGAGLSGLMMAAQLLRYGVRPVIIDQKSESDKQPATLFLHARTLELLRQIGIDDGLISSGFAAEGIQWQEKKQILGRVDFAVQNNAMMGSPYVLAVSREHLEKKLIQQLTENACPIFWDTKLMSLTQDDQAANLKILYNHKTECWQAKWVIGADGKNSMVRRCSGVVTEKDNNIQNIVVADLKIDEYINRHIQVFLNREGDVLSLLPTSERGHYQLIGRLPKAMSAVTDYDRIQAYVNQVIGFELPVLACSVIQTTVEHAVSTVLFRQQCCLFIGNAAYESSLPVGFAENRGMQEAANLGWKVAGILNERLAPRLIYSYATERAESMKQFSESVGHFTGLFRPNSLPFSSWFWRATRRRLQRKLSNRNFIDNKIQDVVRLSEHYRDSPLSFHHSIQQVVQAGDKLPFLPVFDEKKKEMTDLHRWCQKPGFSFLVLGTVSHHTLNIIGQWIRHKYPAEMHLYYLPYSERNSPIFSCFCMQESSAKLVLIRPDMHIAYINDMLNVGLLDTYMEGVMGWKTIEKQVDASL